MHLTLTDIQKANPELYLGSLHSQTVSFERLSSPQMANSKSLVFLSDLGDIKLAFERGCRAFVLASKLKEHSDLQKDAGYLFTNNVTLALARTSQKFFPDHFNMYLEGIDSTAVIHPSAQIDENVSIGAYVSIGPRVHLKKNVSIGSNTVLESDIVVETDTAIEPLVFIGRRTQIGKACTIKSNTSIGGIGFGFAHDEKGHHYQIPQSGKVILEDRVHIGAGCTIDRATFDETRIGEGTKIDNLSHIAHNTIIGKNGLFAGKFATAGSAVIGDNVVCGGRVTVTDHISICDNVQIGGLSGVSNSITKSGAYAGYPLLPIKLHLRAAASISALPQIRRDITKLFSKLGLSREDS